MQQTTHQQEITIVTTQGDRTVEAEVFDGTGLALHRNYSEGEEGEEANADVFVVTHIASGARLNLRGMSSRENGRRFIELIKPLANWNDSFEQLLVCHERYKLKQALIAACTQAEQGEPS